MSLSLRMIHLFHYTTYANTTLKFGPTRGNLLVWKVQNKMKHIHCPQPVVASKNDPALKSIRMAQLEMLTLQHTDLRRCSLLIPTKPSMVIRVHHRLRYLLSINRQTSTCLLIEMYSGHLCMIAYTALVSKIRRHSFLARGLLQTKHIFNSW